jgi:hypothetical protein
VTTPTLQLDEVQVDDGDGVVRLAQLVRGELLLAPKVGIDEIRRAEASAAGGSSFRCGEATVVRADGAQPRYLVFARPDPAALVETNTEELARTLFALPFDEVLAYAAALRDTLRAIPGGGARLSVGLELLPALLDPQALREAVDRDLGADGIPGTSFLDGWVTVPTVAHPGFTARVGARLRPPQPGTVRPALRAMPTRQLHITAGNSPLVPLLSFLRGLITKGACTIKLAADTAETAALLAGALRAVDAKHPITRHTSAVYWPGGDAAIETPLLAAGAYDRVIVWGSAETVQKVRQRSAARTVVFAPRYGVSLVGRVAPDELEGAAHDACVDALIGEQRACTASLVHYVEGSEEDALRWAAAVQQALARWDEIVPRPLARAQVGRLRLLRRGPLLRARWFENGQGDSLRSAVVYTKAPFDLALHPMSRFVLVRRVDRLPDALRWIGPAVATVGVFPRRALRELRDPLAAAGVGHVFPLGQCERSWAGMPHDGLRVLSELVSFVGSAEVGDGTEDDDG